jgi:hypothetical protein
VVDGFVYKGVRMEEASVFASAPRRRLRRPVIGARMSSAAKARLRVSSVTDGKEVVSGVG